MTRAQLPDAAMASLLVLFAALALALHDAVGDLGDMGRSLAESGETLAQSGRDTAEEIRSAGALESEAAATGDDLAASGRQGEDSAGRLATVVALIAFVIPAALLLAPWLPRRLRERAG